MKNGNVTAYCSKDFPTAAAYTFTGSILGAGAVQISSRIRLGIATGLLCVWMLTIPAAGDCRARLLGGGKGPFLGD